MKYWLLAIMLSSAASAIDLVPFYFLMGSLFIYVNEYTPKSRLKGFIWYAAGVFWVEWKSISWSWLSILNVSPPLDTISHSPMYLDIAYVRTMGEVLRGYFLENLDQISQPVRGWLKSILIGDKSELSTDLKESFKVTGLYHLVVLSGLHITVVSRLIFMVSQLPVNIVYALRIINPYLHFQIKIIFMFFSLVAIVVFCHSVGLSPPVQRALLMFVIHNADSLFNLFKNSSEKVIFGLFLQSLLFPEGFLSLSMVLSWTIYILYLVVMSRDDGWKEVRFQYYVTLLICSIFQQFAVLGFVLNPVVIRIFPWLVYSGYFVVMFSDHSYFFKISSFILLIHDYGIRIMTTFGEVASYLDDLLRVICGSPVIRGGLFLLVCIKLFNSLEVLSISKERQNENQSRIL